MGSYKLIGKKIIRSDGPEKATGQLQYMVDRELDGMLYGVLVRIDYPHARIHGIDGTKALALDGVVDVVTAKDIPGFNGYGIAGDDQPVFADEKVRFLGDPVALVVAETQEAAELGAKLVEVDAEELEAVLSMEDALKPGAPLVQEKGNRLLGFNIQRGDVEKAFQAAAFVVEKEYTTPYQEHCYLDMESGLATFNEDGSIEIWCPAQHGFYDRVQLMRILDMPAEKIIMHTTPLGGAFGGKDDMNLQPMLAVAVNKLKRPVKITVSREESFLFSTKRIPFKFHAKTACDENGMLVAHQVRALADGGPFTGISGAVFGYAMENSCGAYFIPNVDLQGDIVFTNNARTGAFRGFGNNQANFMVESQMEQLALAAGLDSIAFRRQNCVKNGERMSYGQIQSPCVGTDATLQMLEKSALWQNRESFKQGAAAPHLKRGVGLATCQHGNGLGNHLADEGLGMVELHEDGTFTAYASTEEMGQGNLTTLAIFTAETLGVEMEQVRVEVGDTTTTKDTGPSTASRVTYIAGGALVDAANQLKKAVAAAFGAEESAVAYTPQGIAAGGQTHSWADVYRKLAPEERKMTGKCVMPTTDVHIPTGLHCVLSHVSQIAGVEVNTLTGQVRVLETEIVPSAGTVINRLGYEGQAEGGVVMSMGFALLEDYRLKADSAPLTKNFQTYLLPAMTDIPEITVTPVELWEPSGPFGAKGLGEPVSIPGAPAITNAIHDAVGIWVYDLPASPEKLLKHMRT